MKYREPSEIEWSFISAFEDLRNSLLEMLLLAKERSHEAWKPYWEVQSLLGRLYAGEEEIVGPTIPTRVVAE